MSDIVPVDNHDSGTRAREGDIIAGGAWQALADVSDAEFARRLDTLRVSVARVEQVHAAILSTGVDYGTVPGVTKPFLLQPGAEKLCKIFHLVPIFNTTVTNGDGVNTPDVQVNTVCLLHHNHDAGAVVGSGIGAANSWETRYRYRISAGACPECGKTDTILRSKRDGGWFCWSKKGGCGRTFSATDQRVRGSERTENPDPWDLLNTLVKMAAKRAHVDAAKRTTATSHLYTQDPEAVSNSQTESDVSDVQVDESRPTPGPSLDPVTGSKMVTGQRIYGSTNTVNGVPVVPVADSVAVWKSEVQQYLVVIGLEHAPAQQKREAMAKCIGRPTVWLSFNDISNDEWRQIADAVG